MKYSCFLEQIHLETIQVTHVWELFICLSNRWLAVSQVTWIGAFGIVKLFDRKYAASRAPDFLDVQDWISCTLLRNRKRNFISEPWSWHKTTAWCICTTYRQSSLPARPLKDITLNFFRIYLDPKLKTFEENLFLVKILITVPN